MLIPGSLVAQWNDRPAVVGNLGFRNAPAQLAIKVDNARKRDLRRVELVPDTHVAIEPVRYLAEMIIALIAVI